MDDIDVELFLETVLQSGALGRSKRAYALLSYLAKHASSKTSHLISEYSIATEVIGRGNNFDPQQDGIVRTEMNRLRQKLEAFSLKNDVYNAQIPRATYLLIVSRKTKPQTANTISISKPKAIGLAVASLIFPVLYVGTSFADILVQSREKVVCSDTLPNVSVQKIGARTEIDLVSEQMLIRALSQHTHLEYLGVNKTCSNKAAAHYALAYSTREHSEGYTIGLSLLDTQSNKALAMRFITVNVNSPQSLEAMPFSIAYAVNEFSVPSGVISEHALTLSWENSSARAVFSCIPLMYRSFAVESDAYYQKTHGCLEKAVASGSAPLDVQGGLAASYLEQSRQYRAATISSPFEEAQRILDRHGDKWINSSELAIAKMAFEADRPDYNADRLRDIIQLAETKYSTNPSVLLTAAMYTGYKLGDWERAKALSDRVQLVHNNRDQSVHIVELGYALQFNQADELMGVCQDSYSENSILMNVIMYSCSVRTGDEYWKSKADLQLIQLGLPSKSDRISFVKSRKFHPGISQSIIQSQ